MANLSDFITVDIPPGSILPSMMSGNQSGNAPVYGCRAWVLFDGTVSADLSGNYQRDGLGTLTVTTDSAHSLVAGNRVFLQIGTGTGTGGDQLVANVTSPTQFSFSQAGIATNGRIRLNRRLIRGSGNVTSVNSNHNHSVTTTQNYTINFGEGMPDTNYAPITIGTTNTIITEPNSPARNTLSYRFQTSSTNCPSIYVAVFG